MGEGWGEGLLNIVGPNPLNPPLTVGERESGRARSHAVLTNEFQ
jgi:hypothetical protein